MDNQHMTPHPKRSLYEDDFLLIVEDDEGVSTLLQRLLSEQGYRTMHARDGKAALEILQQGGVVPSIILLDLIMPRMGGLELVERLERDHSFSEIPIILMSGHGALARGDKIRKLHLLAKPFGAEELFELVDSLARRSSCRWVVSGDQRTRVPASVPEREPQAARRA